MYRAVKIFCKTLKTISKYVLGFRKVLIKRFRPSKNIYLETLSLHCSWAQRKRKNKSLKRSIKSTPYLAGGILAMLSIGSKKTVLANRTSGIQRPHTTWAHRPSSVCLKAPPCETLGSPLKEYCNAKRMIISISQMPSEH